jgi:3-methyladenine DNA glycosylase/8-oxoguanine DNA glycosylase
LRIGYRSKALKRFSSQFSLGEFDERALRALDDTALRRCLLRIYGVGPETVRILLTEAFHRHDTFHHIAPWQQKIYSQLFYGEPLVAADTIIEDINRAYGRWASLAIHYIWEDIFWRRRHTHVDWLEKEIRL